MADIPRSDALSAVQEALRSASLADLIAIAPELSSCIKRVGTEYWWIDPKLREAFATHHLHIEQDNFYSPRPNADDLRAYYSRAASQPIGAAESLCDSAHFLATWQKILPFVSELSQVPRLTSDGYYWDNPFFPNLDAITYHGIIRAYHPARIFEIGAGFSTHIAAVALRRNGHGELHVIEPYPTPKLMELTAECATFHQYKIQDVPKDIFSRHR